ncbi:MAG: hypothetical protein ACJ763_19840, partial [Bdellovibrionia bacterium]
MSFKKHSPSLTAISIIAVAFIANFAQATDNLGTPPEKTCCICTVGNHPGWQVSAFKLGCKHWLGRQSGCDVKQLVPGWDFIEGAAASCKNGKIKLSYIGHGNSFTSEIILYEYLSQLTNPNRLGASVEFDNTSCMALSDAVKVKRLFDGLPLGPGKYIRITGAQSNSVGEFDSILPGLLQVNAVIDTRITEPEYPSCSKVKNADCLIMQQGNRVYCENNDHSYGVLTCQKAPDPFRYEVGEDGNEKLSPRWTQTGTISAKKLFAPLKNFLPPGTYECTEQEKPTIARFLFLESSSGKTYVEVSAPTLNSKAYGTFISVEKNLFANFEFPTSELLYLTVMGHAKDLSDVRIMTRTRDDRQLWTLYDHCHKIDSSQSSQKQ